MKKCILISAIAGCLFFLLTAPARAATLTTSAEQVTQVTETHVILIAQDADTEVELTIDGKPQTAMILQAGVNYMAFKTDSIPDVSILAYGDETKLKVVSGEGRDWYTFARIKPPKDGDGYDRP